MLTLLSIWLAVGICLMWLASQRSQGSAGLPLAYFIGLSIIHVPGAMLYLDAEESNYTLVGFRQTIIGLVAFFFGVLLARCAFVRPPTKRPSAGTPPRFTPLMGSGPDRLSVVYLFVGCLALFVLQPVLGHVGSFGSIIASVGSLVIVGACLQLWLAISRRDSSKFWVTIALLPLLPLATVISKGFLGYGVYWTLGIVTFLFAQSKRRLRYCLLAPAVFFVGLSIFVNYMAARDEIRRVVWYDQVGVGDRLQLVGDVFLQRFEWLDLSNVRHREAIDSRLNQNFLVGAAVARLEAGQVEYAGGSTFWKMIMALIPRAIWPDKPPVAGGSALVEEFTGIQFSEGTSVGAGQVFEFYVNFGTVGVIGGFLLYGWLLGRTDLSAIRYLQQGDQTRFLFWFMISLALLQPGNNLIVIAVSVASAAITAHGLGYLVRGRWLTSKKEALPRTTAG
jgi:hypothetical protein